MPTPVKVSVLVPVLVTVMDCALALAPTVVMLKVSEPGLIEAKPWIPVEPKVTDWLPALVAIASVPDCADVLAGLKRTVVEHVPLADSDVPQVVETKL